MEVLLDIVKAYDIERCYGDMLSRMAVLVDSSGAAQTRMRDKLQAAAQKRRVTMCAQHGRDLEGGSPSVS